MAITFNKNDEMQASVAARKVFGEDGFGPDGGLNPVIYQGNEGVCAIRSQQIILRDYGIDISLEELKQYAMENNLEYLLFCNVSHIEVWLKNILFSQNDFERGKTIAIEMEYYLVNAKTGYVYDGFSRESKTANMINAIIVQGGKNMPVNVLFQRVMEEQVKKVVKDMGNKGLDRLKAVTKT